MIADFFEILIALFKTKFLSLSSCETSLIKPIVAAFSDDISSPEIGGGKICSGYTDNQFNKQPFPGCRSVVSSISVVSSSVSIHPAKHERIITTEKTTAKFLDFI